MMQTFSERQFERHGSGRLAIVLCLLLACSQVLGSEGGLRHGGQLLGTGGVINIEGAAGGGIVPWAVLAGYGTADEVGGMIHYTHVRTDAYALNAGGIALSWHNRIELSVTRQTFDLDGLIDKLGLPADSQLSQNIYGIKARLFGDLIYGDTPQVSMGLQYKRTGDFGIPRAVGAAHRHGTDVYLAASRLFLGGIAGYPVLVSGAVRSTAAHQTGLLGFANERSLVFEGSVAALLHRRLAVGFDFRQKPDELAFAREDAWMDVFVGWFPNKHVSIAAAYARLGSIGTIDDQDGVYVTAQVGM